MTLPGISAAKRKRKNLGRPHGPVRIAVARLVALAGGLIGGFSVVVLVGLIAGLSFVIWLKLSDLVLWGDFAKEPLAAFWTLGIIGGLAGIGVGRSLYEAGKRIAQPSAEQVLAAGDDFVLFLRSFHRDSQRRDLETDGHRAFDHYLLSIPASFWTRPSEEAIVRGFGILGPVVALGRPGELLPSIGAARLYLDDDEWEPGVRELMRKARAVVLVAGNSPSLIQEARIALSAECVSKLVLYVPIPRYQEQESNAEWLTFRQAIASFAPVPLPEWLSADAFFRFKREGSAWNVEMTRPGKAGTLLRSRTENAARVVAATLAQRRSSIAAATESAAVH